MKYTRCPGCSRKSVYLRFDSVPEFAEYICRTRHCGFFFRGADHGDRQESDSKAEQRWIDVNWMWDQRATPKKA